MNDRYNKLTIANTGVTIAIPPSRMDIAVATPYSEPRVAKMMAPNITHY